MQKKSLMISGGTIVDGTGAESTEGQSILVEGRIIRAIGRPDDFKTIEGVTELDARGKYVIPGMMNANVHLLCDIRLENLARYSGQYEDLIIEAAQVSLKNGLTTVFDTWGPRRFLMRARDRINAGAAVGSRIFCAGNIVGLEGPFSQDFFPKASEVASDALVKRINAIWVENVGRHLLWLTPEQVGEHVRRYISKGIDFIKYASNDHFPGALLAFSPAQQAAIVEEAHRAGVTAQAHSMSVEGLRVALEAGCDLITHCNITGPTPIPETTLQLFAERRVGAVIFPFTHGRFESVISGASDADRTIWQASDTNARNLIRCGAQLMLANDGFIWTEGMSNDPLFNRSALVPGDDNLFDLSTGHFAWLKAMEEKGCRPMDMLRAATRNIAVAYGKDRELGTIEPGKIADMIILDRNPLNAAENYRSIHMVIKDGVVVDRNQLPVNKILTGPSEPRCEEESDYVPFLSTSKSFPICPMCMFH